MFMRGLFLAAVAAVGIAAPGAGAEDIKSGAGMPVLRTANDRVSMWMDGRKKNADVWTLDPSARPDVLETTAATVTFASECDTLTVSPKVWESVDLVIVTAKGDSAFARVTRQSANPFEEPSPAMRKIAPSGLLSREQAEFDIRALVYSLSEIHPDIYSMCDQEAFHRAVNKAIRELPDSVSIPRLYLAAAPLVAMIGDGHTNLGFPFNDVFTEELPRRPYTVDITGDGRMVCSGSVDGRIPEGSEILAVNGMSRDSILNSMLPYVAGERRHFRLARLDGVYSGLDYLLYPADSYTVEFRAPGKKKTETVTYRPVTWAELNERLPRKEESKRPPYSYTVNEKDNVAIMDFNEFSDQERMGHFADSMFRDLRERNIGNLIIDLRQNGGGNSNVGDTLLRYISPIPFDQFDKSLVRITPLSARMRRNANITPGLYFFEADTADYINPRSPEEGHYAGRVYLLTSNYTFSSASAFSWTFKEAGCGTVVGEETGGMNVAYGDILSYRMPVSRLRASVSFKRFWQFRANENDIHGTLPDVAVPSSAALDEALRLARKRR